MKDAPAPADRYPGPRTKRQRTMTTSIRERLDAMRAFYAEGHTREPAFRKEYLRRLQEAVKAHEQEIAEALYADLHKSAEESYISETAIVLAEIRDQLRHLERRARSRRVPTPLFLFPSASRIIREPQGVVLVMAPWNYPFQLALDPLVGALAAGNCVALKPSTTSARTCRLIGNILGEIFPPDYVSVFDGDHAQTAELLEYRFDHIFFTGGAAFGRTVMEKAAAHLTPVTLELGGKSPCIVDETANLRVAARRLAFGKLLNCGQTCVAPDYLLISRKVKDAFLPLLEREIQRMVGENALVCDSYVHMVNEKHFRRVCGLIDPDKVIFGGQADERTLRIQPTIMDRVTADDAVMQEEIFGPLLPVIAYDSIDEALAFVNGREHPLALYLFSEDPALQKRVLASVPFGGGCINDTIVHLATSRMGFGVGHSGMGSYHGKKSFDTFSHEKSVLKKSTRIDMPVRYMPYTSLKDRLLHIFLR